MIQPVLDLVAGRFPPWLDPVYVAVAGLAMWYFTGWELMEHLVLVGMVLLLQHSRAVSTRDRQAVDKLLERGTHGEEDEDDPLNDPPIYLQRCHPVAGRALIPFWISYRQYDRCRWLNAAIHSVWPQFTRYLKARLPELLDPLLAQHLPKGMCVLKVYSSDFGTQAPRVDGVKVYPSYDRKVTFDMKLRWTSKNSEFVLATRLPMAGNIHARFLKMWMTAVVRIRFCSITDLPFFGAAGFTFIDSPALGYDLKLRKAGAVLGDGLGSESRLLKGIGAVFDTLMKKTLMSTISFPRWTWFHVARCRSYWDNDFKEAVVGVLVVVLVQARDLINMDPWYEGVSDPYAEICVGLSEIKRSKTIDNELNPRWNETFTFDVHDPEAQPLIIHLLDKDDGVPYLDKDDSLGFVEVDYFGYPSGYLVDQWLTLRNTEEDTARAWEQHGALHIQIIYTKRPPGPEGNDLAAFTKSCQDRMVQQQQQQPKKWPPSEEKKAVDRAKAQYARDHKVIPVVKTKLREHGVIYSGVVVKESLSVMTGFRYWHSRMIAMTKEHIFICESVQSAEAKVKLLLQGCGLVKRGVVKDKDSFTFVLELRTKKLPGNEVYVTRLGFAKQEPFDRFCEVAQQYGARLSSTPAPMAPVNAPASPSAASRRSSCACSAFR